MRREQQLQRQFTPQDVQSLQGLQQQLRLYVAKLRTMLEPVRKQACPVPQLCLWQQKAPEYLPWTVLLCRCPATH